MSRKNFNLYAHYYDLLYKDKPYAEEAKYVDDLIKLYKPSANTLLNLGCGTGKHDYALAYSGYKITGVDRSEEMANQAINNTPADLRGRLDFITGDIRKLNLQTTFDAVISLFHVISYQVANQDMADVINAAYQHLEDGGLFVFDCWYGPGVLTDLPVVRIKRMADETINVTRLAEPVINSVENTVDVNYTILINEPHSNKITEIKETHKMRYFFVPEIEFFIKDKFKLLAVNEWLTNAAPALNTWNAVFILQKI